MGAKCVKVQAASVNVAPTRAGLPAPLPARENPAAPSFGKNKNRSGNQKLFPQRGEFSTLREMLSRCSSGKVPGCWDPVATAGNCPRRYAALHQAPDCGRAKTAAESRQNSRL